MQNLDTKMLLGRRTTTFSKISIWLMLPLDALSALAGMRSVMQLALLSCFVGIATIIPLRADVVSTPLSPLPEFDNNGSMEERNDALSFEFDSKGPDVVGQPGQIVSWGFKLKWASNAGDSLRIYESILGPIYEFEEVGDYVDLMSQELNGDVILAGTEVNFPDPTTTGTHGMGYFKIKADAIPGTTYRGTIQIHVKVFSGTGTTRKTLGRFAIPLKVSVTVGSIELATQTITFPEIDPKTITTESFVLNAVSDSQLPIYYISHNPDLCTIENGVATLLEAGKVTVTAIQEGNTRFSPANEVIRQFEIVKVPASIEIQGQMNQSYTGSDKHFTPVTVPANLPVKWLYNGVETPAREPGIYVIHALIDHPVYTGSAEARLVITDQRAAPVSMYPKWVQTYFTQEEIQNGVITGPYAYVSGDEFSNLFKYAMGFAPKNALSAEDRGSLPRMSGAPGKPTVVFDLPTTAADVIISINARSDLATNNWQEIARRVGSGPWTGTAEVFVGTPNANGTRVSVLVTDKDSPAFARSRFYRLSVTPAP